MRKRLWIHIAMVLVIPGLLLTASCAQKQIVSADDKTEAQQQQEMAAQQEAERAAQQEEMARQEAIRAEEEQAATMQAIKEEAQAREAAMALNAFENENVYFDFDSADLTPMAQDVLVRKAEWLRENPMASVIIEGHCDERGTAEYNMALGERRAMSAMKFLVDLGIQSSRLSTISYGEERPADPGSNEEAWAKNRRDVFDVQ